jgi:plastocyanin
VGAGIGRLVFLAAAGMITPATAAETIRVGIDKLKFDPAQVSAHVGDTIEWTNSDFVAHTATARNKDWDVTIPAKGVGHVTLEHPGDVDYFCRFHPNMMGEISVIP